MVVRSSIFGSRGEKRGFRSIESTWGSDYRVFPQISFSDLFKPDESTRDTSNFFYKTSVDYVLCTEDGKPLLAIDFDGMGSGYNKSGQYVQVEPTTDRHRKSKFDFKIKYARRHGLPYYIVSSEEFEYVDQDSTLTIVDGLIGTELARRDFYEQIPGIIEDHRYEIDRLLPGEQHDYIHSLVTWQGVQSDYAYNPFLQKTAEVMYSLGVFDGSFSFGWTHKYLDEPGLPHLDGTNGSLETRIAVSDHVERVGSECILLDTPMGDISATARMRNIGNYSTCIGITTELAELLAWFKLARLLRSSAVAVKAC